MDEYKRAKLQSSAYRCWSHCCHPVWTAKCCLPVLVLSAVGGSMKPALLQQQPSHCGGRADAAACGSAAAASRSTSITCCSCLICLARLVFCVLVKPLNPQGFCHALKAGEGISRPGEKQARGDLRNGAGMVMAAALTA